MMQSYFEAMISGIEAKINSSPDVPNAKKKYALSVARLGQKLYAGSRVAWCGVAAPFDLLHAMGITSCFVEFIGAMLAGTGMIAPFLQKAEESGFATDTCGYHRCVMGAAQKGLMPVPDFLIATSCPCSAGVATLETLARFFNKDLFVLHIPQENSESSVCYLADQLKDMVQFVSDHTGESLDPQKLAIAINQTNQTRALMQEVFELARLIPSPANGNDLANFGIVMSLLFGTQDAIEVAQAYRDEFTWRIQSKKSGVAHEKIRLLWLQNRIQFKNSLIKTLEGEFQASIVIDELNHITWDAIDPQDPFTGLAKRAISIPFNGPFTQRMAYLQKLARDYHIDGVINPCHWGCRQGTGARGLIQEGFQKLGIPVLNLEVDCVDERNFAEGQFKTRLQAFMEMLGN